MIGGCLKSAKVNDCYHSILTDEKSGEYVIYTEIKLDELDISIARELKLDARQSNRKLSVKLGVGATAIAKRLRRMVDANILSFCCVIDPRLLGFQSRALFFLKIRPGKEAKVVQVLEQHGCVQSMNQVVGQYDLLAYTVFRDHRRQLRWKINELGTMKDVLSYMEIHQLQMMKNSWGGYADRESVLSADIQPLDVDESELRLIGALEINPRETINSLAKKVGLTRQTAAKKLQRLLDEDTMRIISVIDPVAIGFSLHAVILLQVEFDRLLSLADIMTAHKSTSHVAIVDSTYNLLVAAAFRDLGEMSHFLRSELGEMTGVIHRETLIHIEPPRMSYQLMRALDYE